MKLLIAIGVALLIIGSVCLLLGSNQNVIGQEDLAYVESGSLVLGLLVLAFAGMLWIRKT